MDQLSKKIYHLDHLKGEIISSEDSDAELVEPVEELLRVLSDALQKYVCKYYKEPFGSQGIDQ